MNKKFLAFSLVVLIMSACSISTQPALTPMAEKLATLPADDLQSSALAGILKSNGFAIRAHCASPCSAYERLSPQMTANIHENNQLIIQVFKDAQGVLDLQVLSLVVTQAYGAEFTSWITDHLDAALLEDQTGTIGGYTIWMRIYEEKGIINIRPKG
jgi:hypothetical protein